MLSSEALERFKGFEGGFKSLKGFQAFKGQAEEGFKSLKGLKGGLRAVYACRQSE